MYGHQHEGLTAKLIRHNLSGPLSSLFFFFFF